MERKLLTLAMHFPNVASYVNEMQREVLSDLRRGLSLDVYDDKSY